MEYPKGFDQGKMRNKPICGVLSLAICADVDYDVAHAALKAAMPAHRQRFGGRTFDSQREKAMRSLAVQFVRVECSPSMRLSAFVENVMERDVTYMVSSSNHIVTVRNNCVNDQGGCWNIALHKNRNMRVIRYWKIIGKGW